MRVRSDVLFRIILLRTYDCTNKQNNNFKIKNDMYFGIFSVTTKPFRPSLYLTELYHIVVAVVAGVSFNQCVSVPVTLTKYYCSILFSHPRACHKCM